MALTLRVTSFHSQALGADSTRVFGTQGGAIGRALDNDWVLPDPEKFVSSHHAQILFRGGAFYLRDTSTNGTFVNGSPQPVGSNMEHQLNDGDRVQIGDYEIVAALDVQPGVDTTGPASIPGYQQTGSQVTGPTGGTYTGPGPMTTGPHTGPHTGTGMTGPQTGTGMTGTTTGLPGFGGPDSTGAGPNDDILNLFDDGPAAPQEPSWTPPATDHASVMDQNFVPPPIETPPPADDGMIPEDWDMTGFASLDDLPPAPETGPTGTVNQPFPPPGPPTPMRPAVQQQTPPPVAPPAAEGGGAQDVVGMLMAAGLDQASAQAAATPENLAALGQILGITTQGLMDVLTARSAVKSQFRVPMTMMRPVENNALKSSANASEALLKLLIQHNPAYLGPVESFSEGFADVKAHQMAMMAGMRAAFDSMLEQFDPEELEERFKKRKAKSMLRISGGGQYWEMFRDLYAEMTQDADANFQRLFGEEFARAYEDQMQRLTSNRGRM